MRTNLVLNPRPARLSRLTAGVLAGCSLLWSSWAQASFLQGEALDSFADVMAWIVICVVPLCVLTVFWLIHVLPEKIAHQRHHPQRDAIKTLSLLSLVFGGLLWPFAWLWAYSRPTAYKLACGTDKHEDYCTELGEKAKAGTLVARDMEHLRHDLAAMAERGPLPPRLRELRTELDALASPAHATATATAAAAVTATVAAPAVTPAAAATGTAAPGAASAGAA